MKLIFSPLLILLISSAFGAQATSIRGCIVQFQTIGKFRPSEIFLMREDGQMINLWNNTGTDFPEDTSPDPKVRHPTYSERIDSTDPAILHLTIDGRAETLKFSGEKSGASSILSTFRILGTPYVANVVTNISNRSYVIPGKTCITGFVNSGDENRLFLIRAIGSTLSEFEVDATDEASFDLYRGQERVASSETYSSPDWEEINKLAGAFPAKADAKEAILFKFLPPGTYTVVARGGKRAGDILGEVYELGFSSHD